MRISGSNAGYIMFRGSVKGTGYPLHSPVSPSLPLLCVTLCHHISTGVYCVIDLLNSQLNKSGEKRNIDPVAIWVRQIQHPDLELDFENGRLKRM